MRNVVDEPESSRHHCKIAYSIVVVASVNMQLLPKFTHISVIDISSNSYSSARSPMPKSSIASYMPAFGYQMSCCIKNASLKLHEVRVVCSTLLDKLLEIYSISGRFAKNVIPRSNIDPRNRLKYTYSFT